MVVQISSQSTAVFAGAAPSSCLETETHAVRVKSVSVNIPNDCSSWMYDKLLCWYNREFMGSKCWWPALHFPSIQETQRRFVHQMDSSSRREWTLAVMNEVHAKRNQPVIGIFLNDTQIQLVTPVETHDVDSDYHGNFAQNHYKVNELSQRTEQANKDWKAICSRVMQVLNAPTPPRPPTAAMVSVEPKFTTVSAAPASTTAATTPAFLSSQVSLPQQASGSVNHTAKTPSAANHHHERSTSPKRHVVNSALAAAIQPARPSSSPIQQRHGLFPSEDEYDEENTRTKKASASNSPSDPEESFTTQEQLTHRANTDPTWVPPLEAALDASDHWRNVWPTLEFSGWTHRLNMEPNGATKDYWIKPHCSTKDSFPGTGYFTNTYDFQEFCRKFYGWQGPNEDAMDVDEDCSSEESEDEEEEEVETLVEEHVDEVEHHRSSGTVVSELTNPTTLRQHDWASPVDRAYTKPQDPAKPQLPSGGSHYSHYSYESGEDLNRNLRLAGWTIRRGGDNGHVWMRPHLKRLKEGVLGVDYFDTEEDTIEYLKADSRKYNVDKKPAAEGKSTKRTKKAPAKSMPSNKTKARPTKKQESTNRSSSNKGQNKRKQAQGTAPRKRTQKYLDHLVRDEAVRILKLVGIKSEASGVFKLQLGSEVFSFPTLTGLRKFFCFFGIPPEVQQKMREALEKTESQRFEQWIRFADVDLKANELSSAIKEFDPPKELTKFLSKCGCSCFDSQYFVFGADELFGRLNRKKGIHFFPLDELNTAYRLANRGCPRLKDKVELQLWTATIEEPLPTFDLEKAMGLIEKFQELPEFACNQAGVDDNCDAENVADAVEESSATSTIAKPASTVSKFKGRKSIGARAPKQLLWHQHRHIFDDVRPIVTKLGFRLVNGHQWAHKDIQGLWKADQIGKMMIWIGCPTLRGKQLRRSRSTKSEKVNLSEQEMARLLRWASMQYLPDAKEGDYLRVTEKLHQNVIYGWAEAAGFERVGETFYPPGADARRRAKIEKLRMQGQTNALGDVDREKGFDELHGKDALILYLVGTPNIQLFTKGSSPSSERKRVFDMLRIWACHSVVSRTRLMPFPEWDKESTRYEYFMEQYPMSANASSTEVSNVFDVEEASTTK